MEKSDQSLSILIPVFNWDISKLVQRLHNQSLGLMEKFEIEIIVLEDGSTEKNDNAAAIENLPLVTYEYFPVNRGRATLRNLLLERAKGEYILFIDADMLPDDDRFLQRYLDKIKAGHDIICGGISYNLISQVENNCSFYLYKSEKTEAVRATLRNKSPWRYLFTSNILIRRRIAESIKFDSRFTAYGFEDIDWAIRLARSYSIDHIDNTCSHMGLMSKEQTFSRMRESIKNYVLLVSLHPEETKHNSIVVHAKHLSLLPNSILQMLDLLLEKLFFAIGNNPISLLLFQLNKLVIFTKTFKANKIS